VRILFSVVSLLIVVAVIGMLAKKQLTAVAPVKASATAPAGSPPALTGTPKQQVQQFQQAIQGAVQQTPRTDPDDTK
jgi:hypothetical protein